VSHKRKRQPARPAIFIPPAPVQQQYALAQQPVPQLPQPWSQHAVPTSFEVRVQVLADPHATVAHASLYAGGDPYTEIMKVSGSSKRDAVTDEYDEETGTAIAVQRALVNLSRKIGKRAEGRVKHADDNRRQREAVKAGVHPGDADALAAFKALAEGISDDLGVDPDIIVHVGPGMTEDDVPEGLKKMVGSLFPHANVSFTADETADIPAEVAKAVDEFLEHPENGVRRPGKHAKG
jgi:hypothetical protein